MFWQNRKVANNQRKFTIAFFREDKSNLALVIDADFGDVSELAIVLR
jgi:hypothetical protein